MDGKAEIQPIDKQFKNIFCKHTVILPIEKNRLSSRHNKLLCLSHY